MPDDTQTPAIQTPAIQTPAIQTHDDETHADDTHADDTHADDTQMEQIPVSQAAPDAPFVIEHHKDEYLPNGTFRPSARLILTPRVRTSGLWRALTPEDFKTLVLMLTFLTPNGWCRPTLPELADAMNVSHAKAKARLERLLQTKWQGQPLISLMARPDGLDAYLPGRILVSHQDAPTLEAAHPLPMPTASREAVITHSRNKYARTRGEVERQIEQLMGWAPPDFAGDDPAGAEGKRRAFKAMTNIGMPKDKALDLLSRFELGAIERQISWLPLRHAKSPGRFLAAAIEGEYEIPLSLRRQAAEEETEETNEEGENG